MKSFFSRLQSYFDQTYGGRYFELILQEVSKDEPGVIKKLFPEIREKCFLKTEYHYDARKDTRIADLALISHVTGKPLGLVEIKYDDHKKESNISQLKDYLAYCRKLNIPFLYLTQYYPPASDLQKVLAAGGKHMLFSELAERIKQLSTSSQLIRLLVEYLEDKGLIMQQIDEVAIAKFLVRLFNPVRGQKIHSKASMVQEIPEAFQALMSNMDIITQELSRYFPAGRAPAIDMYFQPIYKISRSKLKQLSAEEGRAKVEFRPTENDREGGFIGVFARKSLSEKASSSDWFSLEFGFWLTIEKGMKDLDYMTELYVMIYGRDYDSHEEIMVRKNSILSDKKQCVELFTRMIVTAIGKIGKDKNFPPNRLPVFKEIAANIRGE